MDQDREARQTALDPEEAARMPAGEREEVNLIPAENREDKERVPEENQADADRMSAGNRHSTLGQAALRSVRRTAEAWVGERIIDGQASPMEPRRDREPESAGQSCPPPSGKTPRIRGALRHALRGG